jgi:hypothetical protein
MTTSRRSGKRQRVEGKARSPRSVAVLERELGRLDPRASGFPQRLLELAKEFHLAMNLERTKAGLLPLPVQEDDDGENESGEAGLGAARRKRSGRAANRGP